MNKNFKKKKKRALITIQEHVASSMFELEVVESEDCTQEMDDIVGNINMMETGYGNLTGMNAHLAKEKSHIFDEAKKFFSSHKKGGPGEFGSMDFEEAMNNHSMILPDGGSFLMNNKSMNYLGGSQIFNGDFQSTPNNQMGQSHLQGGGQYNRGNNGRHSRLNSTANRSQMMNSMHFPQNFNQTMNSQVFNNGGYPVRNSYMQRPKPNYGRRATIRQSVLNQYNKLNTITQGMNHSMISSKYSQKNLGNARPNKNISIYTS